MSQKSSVKKSGQGEWPSPWIAYKEIWPSPFGAHLHWWPSPLRPQPSPPPRKNEPSLKEMKKATQEFQKHWEVYLCVVWNANCSFTFANHSKESQKAKEAHPLAAFIQLAIGQVPLFSTLLINQISIYHWFCKSVRKSFLWWSPPITTPNPSKEENVPESGQNCSKKIAI